MRNKNYIILYKCVLDRDVPVLHLTVQVGEKVDFVCNLKDTITPVDWVINQTKYNFNRLPDDYSISLKDEFLILVIDESQLWMNNTLYQCYDNDMGEESDMGLLYVKFREFPYNKLHNSTLCRIDPDGSTQ